MVVVRMLHPNFNAELFAMNFNKLVFLILFLSVSCNVPIDQFTKGKLKKNGDYDLEARILNYSPEKITVGTPVVFTFEVVNLGADNIPHNTYEVVLLLDGEVIFYDRGTPAIKSGSRTKYTMSAGFHHWIPNKKGTYEVKLVVDGKNTLPEKNEDNNISTLYINVN